MSRQCILIDLKKKDNKANPLLDVRIKIQEITVHLRRLQSLKINIVKNKFKTVFYKQLLQTPKY